MKTVELTPQGLIENIEDLVTLPEVALRIARMLDDPTASANDMGREISHDAALTARLLRIANSPVFGQQEKSPPSAGPSPSWACAKCVI